MSPVGENIKKIRKQVNMTQSDLAKKLFITRQTVSNWESGKSCPDVASVKEIAKVLNVDVSNLLDENDLKKINLQKDLLDIKHALAAENKNLSKQNNLRQIFIISCFIVGYICAEIFLEVFIKTAAPFIDNTFYHYFCSLVRPLVIVIITLWIGYFVREIVGWAKVNKVIKKFCFVTAVTILVVFSFCILSGLVIVDSPNPFFYPAYKIGTLGFPFVFVGVLLFVGVASQKANDKLEISGILTCKTI